MKNNTIKPKQAAFCREYVKDFNATQAAIRAGYSTKTARSIGAENLTKPDIQKEITNLTERLLESELSMIRAQVIVRLKEIAFNDNERDEKINKDGNLIAVSRRDRIKCLELLGKYAGLFKDDHIEMQQQIILHIDKTDMELI